MFRLKVTTTNPPAKVRASLKRRKAALANMAPIFRKLHAPIRAHFRKNFNTGGAHGGPAWADFSGEPKYRAMKIALTGNAKPLLWGKYSESQLAPSLVMASHPDHIFLVGRDGVLVGTTLPYARRLAKGGIGPFGERFPGRNPVQIRPHQWRELTGMVRDELIKRANAKPKSRKPKGGS